MAKKITIERLKFCPMCNFEIESSNFYDSINPHHNGKLPYCKTHCKQICDEYVKEKKSLASGIWYTCAELGVPFIGKVYENFISNKEDKIKLKETEIDPTTGKKKYNVIEIKKYIESYNNFYFYYDLLRKTSSGIDIWDSFSKTDTDFKDVENGIKMAEIVESEKSKYLMNWGIQETADDYKFLDECFNKYTKGIEFTNSQQEDLYRDLCRDRLLLRKINDGRYSGEENIDKISQRIARTMSTLKVDQFRDTRPKTISEQLLFAKIAQIEQTKPADLYKEPTKYKDFNKLRAYEKDMVLRPLLNTLCGQKDFNIDINDVEKYNMDNDK